MDCLNILKRYLNKLMRLDPRKRKLIMLLIDSLFIPISVYLASYISDYKPLLIFNLINLNFICLFILIPIYIITGQYKGLTRYIASDYVYKIAFRNSFIIPLIIIIYNFTTTSVNINIKFWFILWLFITSSTGTARIIIRDLIYKIKNSEKKSKTIIYGAGEAGVMLANILKNDPNYSIEFFIDDNQKLWGRSIKNLSIHSPNILNILTNKIDNIFIAIPSLSRAKKRKIICFLEKYEIPVLEIPTIKDLTTNKINISSLRPINIENLLGREKIEFSHENVLDSITKLTILITGAGGSIGSELCKQVLRQKPLKIILLEHNESSLYYINQLLENINNDKSIEIIPILGNCCNRNFIINLFQKHKIDLVFHAAAYKHVPLVEINPVQGIANNIVSTRVICEAAKNSNVKKVIFISTDKAVRPTNVMGASKRLAEMIILAHGEEEKYSSKNIEGNLITFSIVRFGNVIGSSGSVVPLFIKQIKSGGPITLTSPDIKRYFMSIREAVHLVIQSTSLGSNKDIFLLEMGKPVKIIDLAIQMIKLSGLKLKDKNNPNGDIEIIFTGLRPGEKLFEELLIDDKSEKTSNPLIYRAIEKSLPAYELFPKLNLLEEYLNQNNYYDSLILLKELVPEWEIEESQKNTLYKNTNKI